MGTDHVPDDKRQTAVETIHSSTDILKEVLEKVERRLVRRGKFFLSAQDQMTYGSMKRPILQYLCHGAVVGQMEIDLYLDGMWCYAAHNDFDLIPDTDQIHTFPEYVRTPMGWERKGKGKTHQWTESLLSSTMKRLV